MMLNRIGRIALALGMALASASCGDKVSGPFNLGPVTRVRAFVPATGSQAVSLTTGGSISLAMEEFDSRDSVPSTRAQWRTRNAAVASNLGSTFTAKNIGQTYAVGEVSDNGRVFFDSVLVTVVAP
jgi:hypothetical protein